MTNTSLEYSYRTTPLPLSQSVRLCDHWYSSLNRKRSSIKKNITLRRSLSSTKGRQESSFHVLSTFLRTGSDTGQKSDIYTNFREGEIYFFLDDMKHNKRSVEKLIEEGKSRLCNFPSAMSD